MPSPVTGVLLPCLTLVLGVPLVHAGEEPKPSHLVQGKPISHWVAALRDGDFPRRAEAITALGEAGRAAADAVPALVGVFRETEVSPLQPLAALALARLGPRAVPQLEKALADPAAEVRAGAALALGLIGRPARAAAPRLTRLLLDPDRLVRTTAAGALSRVDPPSRGDRLVCLNPWQPLVEDPDRVAPRNSGPIRDSETQELIDILLTIDDAQNQLERLILRVVVSRSKWWRVLEELERKR